MKQTKKILYHPHNAGWIGVFKMSIYIVANAGTGKSYDDFLKYLCNTFTMYLGPSGLRALSQS